MRFAISTRSPAVIDCASSTPARSSMLRASCSTDTRNVFMPSIYTFKGTPPSGFAPYSHVGDEQVADAHVEQHAVPEAHPLQPENVEARSVRYPAADAPSDHLIPLRRDRRGFCELALYLVRLRLGCCPLRRRDHAPPQRLRECVHLIIVRPSREPLYLQQKVLDRMRHRGIGRWVGQVNVPGFDVPAHGV